MVRPENSGWDATLYVRNHAGNSRNISYSSFGKVGGSFGGQRERDTPANGLAIVDDEPGGSAYIAQTASNEDSSVIAVVKKSSGTQPAGYTSLTAATGSEPAAGKKPAPSFMRRLSRETGVGVGRRST